MEPSADSSNASRDSSGFAQAPSLALPKGGGAVRGIGEKFAANPVTGTGSLTIPIATSPGRSGFGPQLALSYDSGSGNGPFGLGWDLSLPAITRKTDKGLPCYRDNEESDVFLLSGAEDLVPELDDAGVRWSRLRKANGVDYRVERFRPRIEGLFARIERWSRVDDPGDVHWRSISKDNILTIYGGDAASRILDPQDDTRIFSWLICETRDDKGNAILYEYLPENGAGADLTKACERNRGGSNDPRRQTNRYLKRIRYGNRAPLLDANGHRPRFLGEAETNQTEWMFEVVCDYGEHDADLPTPNAAGTWQYRQDPFSTYRAGFEIRTCRLCQRVLMFHHFPEEPDVGADCLVRSTDLTYHYEEKPTDPRNPIHAILTSVTQCGYTRQGNGYLKRSLPPVDFEYSSPEFGDTVRDLDPDSLENLPYGLDGSVYQWIDLDGEGLSGVLTEQGGAWLYKRNEAPLTRTVKDGKARSTARFGPVEILPSRPSGGLAGGRQLLDLAGDGQLDLVELSPPLAGFYERTDDWDWQPFQPFAHSANIDWQDPNLKLVDLTGDGHADVLITEDQALSWYRSLAEAGFGAGERRPATMDEERGPRVVFADGTETLFLADLSGDGLTDIARIRNGEVCYWPNLGYGRFGAKVTMDDAPWFDAPDQFDPRRIRLADIDGSGVTDIIYLGRRETQVWLNQSGNAWSAPHTLAGFPPVDNIASVVAVDLLGNGTACLVWSSPLPGEHRAALRYLDLMADGKPHLLTCVRNNLGAETHLRYVSSTWFYLQDREAGRPWITRLPFPVHVVERVVTHDYISGNRFTTSYKYHHGFFDGIERELRGFGMVEQTDTTELATLAEEGELPPATNDDPASHVPPVLTRTWFHTGVYLGREHISDFFAGLLDANDKGEYYREPGLDDVEARARLLPDTVLPEGLSTDEAREACRALKGSMLRQEVYALDGSDKAPHPYTVTEQNFTVRLVQGRGKNRHAVFFTHARETLSYHYERNPSDPRFSHALTLEVDDYGNVLKALAVGYGRRQPSFDPVLTPDDKDKQTRLLITYTENAVTHPIDDTIKNPDGSAQYPDDYRTPLPAETRTFELTGFQPKEGTDRFALTDWTDNGFDWLISAEPIGYEQTPSPAEQQKRLIEHVRIRYRKDDLTLDLLPVGQLEPLALPGESYTLAFTPELLQHVYTRRRKDQPDEPLLPSDPDQLRKLLGGTGADAGGYEEIDGNWWIPSGRVFYSDEPGHTPAEEKAVAEQHFHLPCRYQDLFHQDTIVDYDGPADPALPRYDLLVTRTKDALDNTVTAANDYRVLQPKLVTDANRNRTTAAFDALGLVVATAVMGKDGDNLGDRLEGFNPDPSLAELQQFVADPRGRAASLLGKATTRIVYDLDRFTRVRDPDQPECDNQPPFAATLARETHVHEQGEAPTKIQIGFTYSDGFGREIQKKIQAEPGKAPQRKDPIALASGDTCPGALLHDALGGLVYPDEGDPPQPRWVGTGRTVYNNKGNPVRQYEPFFSATHLYEPEPDMTDTGVSPVLFYDPLERVIATVHPNHTYEKVVFDAWQQTTWDVNDTVAPRQDQTWGEQTGDPRTDPDIAGYVTEYFRTQPAEWESWHAQRIGGQLGTAERDAAKKAAAHANTPAVAHLDTLGRPFLTIAYNRVICPNHALDGQEDAFCTRVELDIEGNQRAVIDAKGRLVMRYDYDIAGPDQDDDEEGPDSIHQSSMEAGERWVLNDVAGNPIRAWDSRGFVRRLTYDELRRPTGLYVTENGIERLAEQTIYGEAKGDALNHRTRVYQVRDAAGTVTSVAYDFKGNLKESCRKLLPAKVSLTWVDWQQPLFANGNDGSYTSKTEYDALNRPHTQITPDKSVHRYTFNEANLLETIAVQLRGAEALTSFVTNIDYNAKGQRERIGYANGATTKYEYDPLTFRLIQLKTARPPGRNGLAAKIFNNATVVQDLRYSYDPAGNITRIADAALKTQFHTGQIDASSQYTYDALYRLIEAEGREHIGQTAFALNPPNGNQGNRRDYPFAGSAAPNDLQALRRYTEQYEYDAVGNFEWMRHAFKNGGWNRRYEYDADSLIEENAKSNRLSKTSLGNGFNHTETYSYHDAQGNDVHGCMTHINSMNMAWDFEDQLQSVDLGGGGTAWYVYDSSGERVRKVIERNNGTRQKERLYLGGAEIYRDYDGSGTNETLERETLHVMDDQQRIALVETKTVDSADPPAEEFLPIFRYQLGNHLGSASLELAKDAELISYEEYHSYGTASFQARSAAEVSLKRYRYTGKERDEETGFSYHGGRYYVPWLGRWTSCDPCGLSDGMNLYRFVSNAPISGTDPTGTKKVKGFWDRWRDRVSMTKDYFQQEAKKAGATRLAQAKLVVKRLGLKGYTGAGKVLMRLAAIGGAAEHSLVEGLGEILLLGPSIPEGFREAGTKLGEGAAKVRLGQPREGLRQMADFTSLISSGENIGEGAAMALTGNASEGWKRISLGVAGGASNVAILRGFAGKSTPLARRVKAGKSEARQTQTVSASRGQPSTGKPVSLPDDPYFATRPGDPIALGSYGGGSLERGFHLNAISLGYKTLGTAPIEAVRLRIFAPVPTLLRQLGAKAIVDWEVSQFLKPAPNIMFYLTGKEWLYPSSITTMELRAVLLDPALKAKTIFRVNPKITAKALNYLRDKKF